MIKRYPETARILALIVGLCAFVGVAVLWRPAAYILVGLFWLGALARCIHDDRKRQRR